MYAAFTLIRISSAGKSTFTATDIMEIIFENEDSIETGNSTQSPQFPDRLIFQTEKQEPHRDTERQVTKTMETSHNSTASVGEYLAVGDGRVV